jgi:hypothetical protein
LSDVRGFVAGVQSRYGMRPVVPLEQPVAIGDIGTIGKDGAWNPISTTRFRFGVEPENVRSTRDGRGIWSARSGKDVSFKAYARGQTSELVKNVADAKARAEISFASSSSFVFAAKGVTIRSATEMSAVIDAIRRAYHLRKERKEETRWYRDFVVVFAVGDAQHFTALLARQAKTTVAVTGRGSVGPPTSPAKLAAAIEMGISSNELQGITQPNAVGRLYRAYRLDPSILRKWDKEKFVEVTGFAGRELQFETPTPAVEETFTEV